ncbi:MAG: SBBP repeat-containing protein, partial [Actinomycetota bacterium]
MERRPAAWRLALLVVVSVSVIIPSGQSTAGAPGDLDPEFGDRGLVKGPGGYPKSVTADDLGNIYVAGCLKSGCSYFVASQSQTLMITKYGPKGVLDSSFATQGRLLLDGAKGMS